MDIVPQSAVRTSGAVSAPLSMSDAETDSMNGQSSTHIGVPIHPEASISINSTTSSETKANSVANLLHNMYAHRKTLSRRPPILRGGQAKTPFLSGKPRSAPGSMTSAQSSISAPEDQPQASTSSLEKEMARRMVGRGGSGSRLRPVILKHDILPKPLDIDTVAAEPSAISLRPSGRGGLASRPKHLASPPSSTKYIHPTPKPIPDAPGQAAEPRFVRPSGRGGAGASSSSSSSVMPLTLALKRNLSAQTKPKVPSKLFNIQRQPRRPMPTPLAHPISSHMAYEITHGNPSTGTLSTLHFTGESTGPPPVFFPGESGNALDIDFDSTPPFSATASTFGSLSILSEDSADPTDYGSVYVNDSRPASPAANAKQQRSLIKLVQTFGSNPYGSNATSPANGAKPARPKVVINQQPDDMTRKMFRRASFSLFSRRHQNTVEVASLGTLETITDDLHQLGFADDELSAFNASGLSVCDSPRSPILFSPPSPSQLPQQAAALPAAEACDDDSDSMSFVPAPALHGPSKQHARSKSTTLSESAFFDASREPIATSEWLFPPTEHTHEGFKMTLTRGARSEKSVPLQYTGQWNSDIDDVIRSLRELR